MSKTQPPTHDQFKVYLPMPTRWADNDQYGHVNNVTYYSYFDTAVNQWLIVQGLLDIHSQDVHQPIGLVVDNRCQFYTSIAFPQQLEIGIRVEHIGNSSVRFGLGVFIKPFDTNALNSANAHCAAYGQFTHVYVNRQTRQPMALSAQWRSKLTLIQVPQ